MTADDDLRLIGMVRTLLTKLERDQAAFETAMELRIPKARRMSDELRDTLRTRIQLSGASDSVGSVSEAGDVAVRSVQAIELALGKKPDALPLAEALWQAKEDLKKWEDRVLLLKKKRGW
jgi:hypothetical protein